MSIYSRHVIKQNKTKKKPYEGLCEVELLENAFCFGMRAAETHSDVTSSSNKTFRQKFSCSCVAEYQFGSLLCF